jgi:energy-coupling factor transporter ATP-binding protein EcfA2
VCDAYSAGINLKKVLKSATSQASSLYLTGESLVSTFREYYNQADYTGFDTGYSCINEMLGGGLKRGEVLGLVGNSGCGKTTLAKDIALNLSKNTKVFWVGTEMSAPPMTIKFIETMYSSRIELLSEAELERGLEKFSQQFLIYAESAYGYEDIEAAIIDAIYSNDIGVVVFDVRGDIDSQMSEYKDTKTLMKRINRLANGDASKKRPPIAIVCIIHCVKVDGRFLKKPSLSSIEGARAVVTNLTCVIGVQGLAEDDTDKRTLYVLKRSRMGETRLLEADVWYDDTKKKYIE